MSAEPIETGLSPFRSVGVGDPRGSTGPLGGAVDGGWLGGFVARAGGATFGGIDDPVVVATVGNARTLDLADASLGACRRGDAPPLPVGTFCDPPALSGLLRRWDHRDVGSNRLSVAKLDAPALGIERARLANHLPFAVDEPPDTDGVGQPVQVCAGDVALGREDDPVDQAEGNVETELAFEVARAREVRFVLDGRDRADPVGIAGRLADVFASPSAGSFEKADLDRPIDRSSGVGRVGGGEFAYGAGFPRADCGLDRPCGDRFGGDRCSRLELGARFDPNDIENSAPRHGDRPTELPGEDPPVPFEVGAQRQLEGELAHGGVRGPDRKRPAER